VGSERLPAELELKYRKYWVEVDEIVREASSRVRRVLEGLLREFRADFGGLVDEVAKELGVDYSLTIEYDEDNPARCKVVMWVIDGEDKVDALRSRLGDVLDAARIVVREKKPIRVELLDL